MPLRFAISQLSARRRQARHWIGPEDEESLHGGFGGYSGHVAYGLKPLNAPLLVVCLRRCAPLICRDLPHLRSTLESRFLAAAMVKAREPFKSAAERGQPGDPGMASIGFLRRLYNDDVPARIEAALPHQSRVWPMKPNRRKRQKDAPTETVAAPALRSSADEETAGSRTAVIASFIASVLGLGFVIGCAWGRRDSPDFKNSSQAGRYILGQIGYRIRQPGLDSATARAQRATDSAYVLDTHSIACGAWVITYDGTRDTATAKYEPAAAARYRRDPAELANILVTGTTVTAVMTSNRWAFLPKLSRIMLIVGTAGTGWLGYKLAKVQDPDCGDDAVQRAFLDQKMWQGVVRTAAHR
ncbi:MAG TPA: hypothetical protein VIP11_14910 [Gemmatimonadaceae bacterium]